MQSTRAAGLFVAMLSSLLSSCQPDKFEPLSAPENRIHLNASSLAPPPGPPPPGPPSRADIKKLEPAWRKNLRPLISLTPEQRKQLKVTAYFGDRLGCGTRPNCFLDMRYLSRKQITGSARIDSLLTALNNSENYGLDHMGCFSPGIGLILKAPGYSRKLLICLQCQHLLVEGDEGNPDTRMLNDIGVAALENEFRPIFPKEFSHRN